jgi:hypothetical protein
MVQSFCLLPLIFLVQVKKNHFVKATFNNAVIWDHKKEISITRLIQLIAHVEKQKR